MEQQNLRSILSEISEKYLEAKKENFESHKLADKIRNAPKDILRKIIPEEEMKIDSSPGKGRWANIPWIAVFNKKETDGAQEGIYVVYLFSEDMKNIYLTLNQGVTKPKERMGENESERFFQSKSQMIKVSHPIHKQNLIGFKDDNLLEISNEGLGWSYKLATIFYKKYDSKNLPENQELEKDLKTLINFYNDLLIEDSVLTEDTDFTGFTDGVEEGKLILKQHYIRERNPRIIKEAKNRKLLAKGELRCEVCRFCFGEKYGKRGKDYIEGHHEKKAVSEMLPGDKTSIEDIVLVCSNCHRMIHKKMPWLSVDELKKIVA